MEKIMTGNDHGSSSHADLAFESAEAEFENMEYEVDSDQIDVRANCFETNSKSGKKPGKFCRVDGTKYDDEFFKPPTAEELGTLRETQALFHSNLFKLQTQEIFEELTIKQKYDARFRTWFGEFANFVKNLDKTQTFLLEDLNWLTRENLFIPLPLRSALPKLMGKFSFVAPSDVRVIGSYALGLATKNSLEIDIALVLPQEIYHKRELYDGRYIICRAIYLAFLAKHLKQFSRIKKMEYTQQGRNTLRPVLRIIPEIKGKLPLTVLLHPVPPPGHFRPGLLDPSNLNLRSGKMYQLDQVLPKQIRSPVYNWTCGVDATMIDHNSFILDHLTSVNIKEGLKLFRLWWHCRKFSQGPGGMSFHVVLMFAIYLLKQGKINEQMSSYQVYRTILLSFIECNWKDGTLSLSLEDKQSNYKGHKIHGSKFSKVEGNGMEDIPPLYLLNFTGPDGFINLVGSVYLNTISEIQHECRLAISFLEAHSLGSFDSLFVKSVDFDCKFDYLLKVTSDNEDGLLARCTDKPDLVKLDMLYQGSYTFTWNRVIELLVKGLGNRVDLMAIKREPELSWPTDQNLSSNDNEVTFGLVCSSTAFGLLTKGPPADSLESEEFKEFWGKAANLRRFRDGSFHETVMWGESHWSVGSRRRIPTKVAGYILAKYLHFGKKNIGNVSVGIENFIGIEKHIDLGFDYGTGEECIQSCTVSFNSLCSVLRSVELPLKISTLICVSDVIRHGHVFPPLRRAVPSRLNDQEFYTKLSDDGSYPHYTHTIDALIFLEVSGKWPDDLLAISAIKVEFLCSLADELRRMGYTCNVHTTCLIILWEGYMFRFKIGYRREIYLRRLVPVKDNNKVTSENFLEIKEKDTEDSLELEKEIEVMPRLNAALSNLNNEYSSYSSSVRIAMRWLSSQMLLCQFDSIAIELIMAYIFVNPAPFLPPHSPHAALLRFWDLVAETDWSVTPLMVNVGGQFSSDVEAEIMKQFTEHRQTYPKLFICTPCELRGDNSSNYDISRRFKLLSTWTRNSPDAVILSRFKVLCQSAFTYYRREMSKMQPSLESLFTPSLDQYDVLIYLKAELIARRAEKVSYRSKKLKTESVPRKKLKIYEKHKNEAIPVIDFDPIDKYFRELQNSFSQYCLFFYDIFGGSVIGVVWKPCAHCERDAKLGSIDGHHIIPEDKLKMAPNTGAFLQDFEILGKGLVERVEVH